MTEEKKTYLQHAFRYGTIIGFVSFIYYLIGFYTGFEEKVFIFDNLYFFLSVALFIVMMSKYRNMQQGKVKFSRYLAIGFVASVITAFFISAYTFIRVTVLDTYLIYQIISLVEKAMPTYQLPELTSSTLGILKISYVFANFFVNIFNNMIYIMLISAFMVWNSRMYNRNTNK